MNGIINKNQLTVVKEYEFDKPRIHKDIFVKSMFVEMWIYMLLYLRKIFY